MILAESDTLVRDFAPIDYDIEALDNLFAPLPRELEPAAGAPELEVLAAIAITDRRKYQIRQQLTAGVPVRYIVTEQ